MENSRAAPPVPRATALTRALCLLVLLLMLVAASYGVVIALRYFNQIGV